MDSIKSNLSSKISLAKYQIDILFVFFSLLLFFSGFFPLSAQKPGFPEANFWLISDPHFFDPSLGTKGKAFEEYLEQDRKLLRESPYFLKEDEAALLAGQVANAFLAHYAGDEEEKVKPFDLKGVGLKGRFLISFKKKLVFNLWQDLDPQDNNVVIEF